MAYSLENKLVVAVSSRALFDLSKENTIFETQGVRAYRDYQVAHENDILLPGPGFGLIAALLHLNELPGRQGRVEVIVMSRNSADTSLRIFNSIQSYGLDIVRAVLVSGASLAPYLNAFQTNLFLSACEEDVQQAVNAGIAAGIICQKHGSLSANERTVFCKEAALAEALKKQPPKQIRIAFDGDAVLFSDESERIYQEQGLEAFEENEKRNAACPLQAGPFAGFLRIVSDIQREFAEDTPPEQMPIRTALVTARSAPAHERVIRTLRAWGIRIDEAFFLGGIAKRQVLQAFGAQMFFDDQALHIEPASEVVPAARVPYLFHRKVLL